jgi:metal transporter CNNM
MDYIIVLVLIILSGTFSGLTIGLLGLSKTEVLRAKDLGDSDATTVFNVIQDTNLLLVTLLLGNTAVNATLSIFLGSLVGAGVLAGVVSTILIMIFGEILPASFVTRYPLRVGSVLTPIVKFFMFILFPITKPIAMLLDKYVGTEGMVIFSRRELKHIFEQLQNSNESDIDELDKKALVGTILLSEKIAGDHMSRDIFTLTSSDVLNKNLLKKIKDKGYTRIPIVDKIKEKDEYVGILNAKQLIDVSQEENKTVKDIMSFSSIYSVLDTDKLDDIMNKMIKNKLHISLVTSYNTVVGVITLEDILEELLLTEIIDEFDEN